MFTGLIQAVGQLTTLETRGNYRVLTIKPERPFDQISLGESIACDGACLTVIASDGRTFTVEASQETIARTTLKNYRLGQCLNLERALKVGDRLGGHFVSGHVDSVGRVDQIKKTGHSLLLDFNYDPVHSQLVIEKGSIAVNGISLTVNQCSEGFFSVNIIPHSVASTNLSNLKRKDKVNLEFDMLGKYVVQMSGDEDDVKNRRNKKKKLTIDKLTESGW